MNTKKLIVAQYVPTKLFKNIRLHTAVCFDDMNLVAVTGPAGDKESLAYAQLFAAAPELLEALKAIVDQIDQADLPVTLAEYRDFPQVKKARAAIAKAMA